jgi:predicted enzyme related to lactoylglutathione lyase
MGAMKVLGIDNVLFAVGDLPRAVRFYGTSLELPLKFQVPAAGIALFRLGDEEPGLLIREAGAPEARPVTSPRVWLEVADARAAAAELAGRGVQTLGPPFEVHTGWTVEVADPWGNVLGFTDYVNEPSRGRAASKS